MTRTGKTWAAACAACATLALAGCATVGADTDYGKAALEMLKHDFRSKGPATVERVASQDEAQKLCSEFPGDRPSDIAAKIEAGQMATIKLPADGKLMGDWKSGQKIAESGRGMTWSDKPGVPNGGSCYNCHQIAPQTTSFGTIGNSLLHFGKIRGYGTDMQKYVYGKIYNAKAYNLCSKMPRFGHSGTLTEQQIKDLVALLLDPNSPVNK
jgi:sulfur-oxidizing protein SoxX